MFDRQLWVSMSVAMWFGPAAASAATLTHEYKFDGASVVDSVGGLNGALFGGASVSGGFLHLDGVDDYAELNGYAIPTGGDDFSVVVKAQQHSVQTGEFIELFSQGVSNGPGFYLGHTPGRNIRVADQNNSIGALLFPDDGFFHDYVVTSGNTNGTRLYIDGSLVFSAAELVIGSGNEFTRFGRQFDPFEEFFHGKIDYISTYGGELTANEVANISDVPAVPLPASFWLLAAAFGSTGLMRKTRHSRRLT